ncbi:MAG: cyclic nucleotide-binding domain-containing protein [Candidatus Glassbacteria bacterium]|nr:cyclic nucleotide-binding domain-containing protein [Candidatus Glassbacteria bacterium]
MSRISALWGNVFNEETNERSVAAVLRRIPVFTSLSKTEMRQVEKIVYLRNYHEGEVIFVEGEPGAGMYVIDSGKIRICLGPNTDEDHEIAMLENGDFFGDLALIDDHPRSATAVAVTPTRLIGFFRSELISIISRSPRLGVKLQQNMMQILVRRLRITDQRLNDCNENLLELQQQLEARSSVSDDEQA